MEIPVAKNVRVSRGAMARVHFWYTPDSYDQNLPADVAPEKLEPDKRIRGKCPA